MYALQVKNLTKRYPAFTLDGVSFAVEKGRITGLIGRNGAGKSTTLKGIFNLIKSEGEVFVFGKRFSDDEKSAKEEIGYVGGGFRFYPQKTLRSVARAVSRFYESWNETAYRQYLAQFALDESKKVSELSEGMKVKFAIALALSHGAKLLILDEPTSGLDPLSREEFCDTVLALVRTQGVSVLFSTHITGDLERIADDVVYIADGRVMADESLESLTAKYRFAVFATEEEAIARGAIGRKQAKKGWEGLLLAKEGDGLQPASLDRIMIHLERERARTC